MIPKKIHYCWFGKGEKSKLIQDCIASWKRVCPDYEIVEWNEDNFDLECIPYVASAYKAKRYAHVTDYARLKIVYENGGIYLDTDVELIASLDRFLSHDSFFAMQHSMEVASGLGFGAVAGAAILAELMENYEHKPCAERDSFLSETCVETDKPVFERRGLAPTNKVMYLEDTVVYPPRFFDPKDFETGKTTLTEDTVSIHHYSRTWHDECERLICDRYAGFVELYGREEAKVRFGRWYKRNHLCLLIMRYGVIGLIKKAYGKILK